MIHLKNLSCISSEDMFQAQFKVPVDPEEYARDNLKFGLVEVVYEWAKVYTS